MRYSVGQKAYVAIKSFWIAFDVPITIIIADDTVDSYLVETPYNPLFGSLSGWVLDASTGTYSKWVNEYDVFSKDVKAIVQPDVPPPTVRDPLHCIRCGYGDQFTTEPNLTNNRFVCFSCRDGRRDSFKDQML